MFTVKIENENDKRNRQQTWMCARYNKLLTEDEHILTLHGVVGEQKKKHFDIDLLNLPEDNGGKYSQTVYIMNEQGQTIDRIGH
jgi:hypothetical protein